MIEPDPWERFVSMEFGSVRLHRLHGLQWQVVDLRPHWKQLHVIPHGDHWKPHEPELDCWCKPTIEAQGAALLVIHEAMVH